MKISDLHNDFLTEISSEKNQKKYFDYLKRNKRIKHVACVVWTSKLKNPLDYLSMIHNKYFNKRYKDKFLLCIEDLGFINENNYQIVIKKIIELKPFYCGLVWNHDNNLGGGALGKKGLSKLGIEVVKKLELNNILIDTAHMNEKTFWQFSKITSKPIINSHSNIKYFNLHRRNLSDKQIKRVKLSQGFIGYSFVQSFISKNKVDSKIVARQIHYLVKKYGDEIIGLGTDFFGTNDLPFDLKTYDNINNLKKNLKDLGLSNTSINKILYKNFDNFIKNLYIKK